MGDCLNDCLVQLFCITDFCSKQKIPFEVYAFRSGLKHGYMESAGPLHSHNTGDFDLGHFHLMNLLSSKMSYNLYTKTKKYIMGVMRYRSGIQTSCWLNLGSTPLNNTIAAAMQIVPLFKKENNLQIVNTVFITDGASDNTREYFPGAGEPSRKFFYEEKMYIRDNVTKTIKKVDGGGRYVTGGKKSPKNC